MREIERETGTRVEVEGCNNLMATKYQGNIVVQANIADDNLNSN